MMKRLSLRARVMLWVSLAVAVPMALLLTAAFQQGQRAYANEVRQDLFGALDRTAAALDRRFLVEHDLVTALAGVPQLRAFLPSLLALQEGGGDPAYEARREAVAGFVAVFQGVRRSLGTVRVLDHRGDTLIKLREGHSSPPVIDNLDAIPVIENGSENAAFRAALAALRPSDVGSLASPPGFDPLGAVLNTVLPLAYRDQVVGYLVIGPPLEPLDRTLDVAARPRGAALLVAEINPDDASRHGQVLYADTTATRLAAIEPRPQLQTLAPRLLAEGFTEAEGSVMAADGATWYFRQYAPYPDRLLGWTLAYRLEPGHLHGPLWRSDVVLWGIPLVALAIGALMAQLAARMVTAPVAQLAERLGRYAQTEWVERLPLSGPPELHAAHAAFNRMADDLDRLAAERDTAQQAMVHNAKLTAVGQLAAGIAHEVSNPLANIFSLTKLLQRDLPPDADQARSDVDNIRAEAERASRIIRGLLDFARRGDSHKTRFGVAGWLRESAALVERLAQEHAVTVQIDELPEARLEADRGLLQQALVNVLINAVQATPAGGTVRLAADLGTEELQIRVADQGPGIAPAARARLFDPFFTTKAEGQGTGLGLSIALGIVEQHGGHLTLENLAAGGALARLRLPVAAAAAPAEDGA